ncbi:PLP-dependent aminotransferase family protein [Ketobacter sp. MCCC 1A13808]|uniref:aminotransferase-like domain-containing protein n=1 Tax=Ketobacter sp. MCCC 1A13808 TaxID=2602738 RepID=UPI000F2123E9|nr:PLP-dependent aminotransferase family protein [Ketobacter sp. MCCC 1A13808]MVF11527.1 PLP-dependent aminotransferase family protein [Ketobacter sp. MCCC 1A13808]RLP53270.1 MAG: PLP-dependent aminotransferase family protein [Ketobacter sp.]
MPTEKYRHWVTELQQGKKRPAYLLIADLIESDIDRGVLQTRDRLPALRDLADLLSLNYTTVTRAYKEASNRGLIDSHPGSGSFIKGKTHTLPLRNGSDIEMTMNSPPEIEDAALIQQVRDDMNRTLASQDLPSLLRYQDFGGSITDKEAGALFLHALFPRMEPQRILVCPGIHSALLALLSLHCSKSNSLCVGSLVYPGLKAIAAQLGIQLLSVDSDQQGPRLRALETLCKAEKIHTLYVNPTLQNPSTASMSRARREGIADLALRYNLTLIEDDAYGLVPEIKHPPIATYAPELTYYINGFSKCFGAGCRTAYLYAPTKLATQRVAGALRALSVMSSPITTSLATRWIQNGTVSKVTQAQRQQSRALQQLAKTVLHPLKYQYHGDGFHLWLPLPKSFSANPSDVAVYLRNHGISAVSSAAFCTDNNPPDAIRLCLGGAVNQKELQQRLILLRDTLQDSGSLMLM